MTVRMVDRMTFETDLKSFGRVSEVSDRLGRRASVARMMVWAALIAVFCSPERVTAQTTTPRGATTADVEPASPTQLRQFTIRDRANGVEWLRSSMGQVWNGFTCMGEPRMLTLDEARSAAAMARAELGGEWRLPTLQELERLVCKECEPPKIDGRLFPRTTAAPYWTESKNRWSVGRYWTVNFFTGYTFGRNMPGMARYVRLVQDFPPSSGARSPNGTRE